MRGGSQICMNSPGVNEPGTPKITTRLLATSSEKEIGDPSSCWIEIDGAEEPTEGPDILGEKRY